MAKKYKRNNLLYIFPLKQRFFFANDRLFLIVYTYMRLLLR